MWRPLLVSGGNQVFFMLSEIFMLLAIFNEYFALKTRPLLVSQFSFLFPAFPLLTIILCLFTAVFLLWLL